MKTYFARQISLGLAAGVALSLGCARPRAEAQPKPQATPVMLAQAVPATAPTAAPVAPTAPASVQEANAVTAVVDTNAPAIVERIPAAVNPENVAMSTGLTEVAKLAQAGVSEDVLLAFVQKYSGRFEVGAEQILYLNDLGVSSAVITAMLKHDGADPALANTVTQPTAPATTPPPNTTVPVVTAPNAPPAQVEQQVTTTVAPPPTSTEVSYFYDTLSPYGSWVYLSGYGWCWQPTVAVSVPTWRPYCDRGRWYWSDAGWYWNSDYSWGWAAFHYGRWYNHAGCGWVWRPGLAWAPSWVSWRYYDGYCGWAPLPPEAHFVHGSGFTYFGRHVTVGFDFGLAPHHYAFVSINNFCDYSPYRHVVPHTRVQNFYRNTTVVNNYIIGNNNTIVNNGIGRDTIARASTTRVREVTVRDTPVNNMARVRGDRVGREGERNVVYRPQLPKDPPRIQSAQFVTRNDGPGRGANAAARRENGITTDTIPNVTRGQNGRGQSTVASRPNRNENNEAVRPQPNTTEERKPVTNQRGNPNRAERNVERNTAGNTAPAPQVGTAAPARPAGQAQTQTQPQRRNNGALFDTDDNTPAARQPRNNGVAANSNPRGQSPVTQPNAQNVPSRANPQTPTSPQTPASVQPRQNQSATAQVQPRGQGAGQTQTERSMPPRQVEQVPRYSAPNAPVQRGNYYNGGTGYQAPVYGQPSHPAAARNNSAPQNNNNNSAPQTRTAPSGGSERVTRNEGTGRSGGGGGGGGNGNNQRSNGNGGGAGNGGGGGGGRVERNR